MSAHTTSESTALAARLYLTMARIRATETRLLELFDGGELEGTTHTSIGQEAVAVAVGDVVRPTDLVFSTHRCHGHFLATGGGVDELIAEIMGRETGVCGGRGGSQHLHKERFFSNGIQGGVVGNAVGMALAERLKGTDVVTVAFLGDGTLGEGLVYESLNFAALKGLRILFVLENNGYSQSTPSALQISGSITARAEALGVPADQRATNDAIELRALLGERLEAVRTGGSPYMQVIDTYRLAPHSKGDDDRDPAEIDEWRTRDPVKLLRAYLNEEEAAELDAEAAETVNAAVARAREANRRSVAASAPLTLVPETQEPAPWAEEAVTGITAINRALARVLEEDDTSFVLGEDILDPYGGAFKATKGLSTRFGERVIPTPLSEAGIVAWATGAALRGRRPIAEIMFGDFLALAMDQLVNHASKYRWMYDDRVEVPMVVRTPMGGRRGYGPTHSQSLQAMLIGVPGLVVVAPSHLLDPGALLERCVADLVDPAVFVEHKLLYGRRLAVVEGGRSDDLFVRASDGLFPTVHVSFADFADPDVVLFAHGNDVSLAIDAARELLVRHEKLCDVVAVHQLSPTPRQHLVDAAGRCGEIAVLEEGPVSGGWGGEVISTIAEATPELGRRFIRMGAPASALPSSRALELEILPSVQSIVTALAGPA